MVSKLKNLSILIECYPRFSFCFVSHVAPQSTNQPKMSRSKNKQIDGPKAKHVRNKLECLSDPRNQWINRKYNFDNLGQVNSLLIVLYCSVFVIFQ